MTVEEKKSLFESLRHELFELVILKSKSLSFPTKYCEDLISKIDKLKLEIQLGQ